MSKRNNEFFLITLNREHFSGFGLVCKAVVNLLATRGYRDLLTHADLLCIVYTVESWLIYSVTVYYFAKQRLMRLGPSD